MTQGSYVFKAPPNWPAVPAAWTPPEGWQPDPSWGPAPDDWEFWQYVIPEQPVAAVPPWAAPPPSPPTSVTPEPTATRATPAAPPAAVDPRTVQPTFVAPPAPAAAPAPPGPVGPPTFLPVSPRSAGRNWFSRHKVLTGVGGLLLLLVAISATGGGSETPETTQISLADASRAAGASGETTADKAAADKAAAAKAAAKAAADKAAAAKAAAAKAAKSKGPADQQAVLAAVVAGRAGFEATDNELKQRQAQRKRAEELRAAVPGLEVSGWIGEIKNLDTNGEGKAVLELKIGSDTKVGTWNNAFSDFDDKTLISMDSPMYATLVDLEEGAKIRFSGSFFSDEENGLKEKSLTFFGQMNTPNFLFRFTEVTPL